MQDIDIEAENINTLLQDTWRTEEAESFWNGYEAFLDRTSTVSDDDLTIAMQVYA